VAAVLGHFAWLGHKFGTPKTDREEYCKFFS